MNPNDQEDLTPIKLAVNALRRKRTQTIDLPSDQQAAVTQAVGMLSKDKDPISQIGKAIQTPNYAGYCLKWVDDQTGNKNRLPTAYADYQANAQQGNINTSTDNIPKGARVYFSPNDSNGQMGHIGISNGDNTFTSATDNGIKTFNISDWQKLTGQSVLGWSTGQKAS